MAYTNIDDPSAYFQTVIWTGNNGSNVNVVNDGNSDLQPDLIWAKERTSPGGYDYNHNWVDSSRGVTKTLWCDSSAAEMTATQSNYDLQSFNTDGFTTGAPEYTNSLGGSAVTDGKVAWQWKANGGTTASNTDGTITSTVQANQDAGFSIVTYTGNGSSSQTVGHGLGVAPDFILVKSRNSVATTDANWIGYHKELTASYKIQLNKTVAAGTSGNWSSTSPTTSVFSILSGNGGTNASGGNFVAYCFAEKQGYSKFGNYVGNGNSNGPFVYTGFKPAFVLIKRTDSTGGWTIYDIKRGVNGNNYELFPHSSEAEHTATSYFEADILSNGFKLRLTDGQINASGGTYIYMAFAENPFVTSTGIPTTAR